MILYRPVGEAEYRLIAEQWNVRDQNSGFRGYVARFEADDGFPANYAVQTVGRSYHRVCWIPAEDLPELNRRIRGKIQIIQRFGDEEDA